MWYYFGTIFHFFNDVIFLCFADLDTDFDLRFFPSKKSGMATQQEPFLLGNRKITLMLWVRFAKAGGKGTFFNLYGLRYVNTATLSFVSVY